MTKEEKDDVIHFWRGFDRIRLICVIEFLLRQLLRNNQKLEWSDAFLTRLCTYEDGFAILEEELEASAGVPCSKGNAAGDKKVKDEKN